MGTLVRLDRRSTPASRLAESGMELGEAGRRLTAKLAPLAGANPWLRAYLAPCLADAARVEREGRRIAGMSEPACADGILEPGHGRAA